MSEWRKIEEQPIDRNVVTLLVDGDSIYIQGSSFNCFFYQISGEMKPIGSINFTHWMPIPKLPEDL